jgi:hypothetical protein
MNYSLPTKIFSRLLFSSCLSACYSKHFYRLRYIPIFIGFTVTISVTTGCDRQTFSLGRVPERVTTFTLQHEKPEPVVYSFTPDRNVPGLNKAVSDSK